MSFYAQYPASSSGNNASVGINGAVAPTSSTEVAGVGDDGNLHPLHTDNSGNLHVIVDSGPAGGATAANQVLQIAQETGIHSDTTSIDSKTPALGQATMANSSPVVIASDQSPVPVTGTFTNPANGNTGAPVPAQATQVGGSDGVNLIALSVDSSGIAQVAVTNTIGVTQSTSPWTVNGAVSIVGTVPVSGPLTDAQLRATPVPVSGTVSTGGLTDAELRASPVPVSLTSTTITGTVAVTQSTSPWVVDGSGFTQPISAAALPLPSGASTAANQTTGNSSLSSIDSKIPSGLTVTSTRLLVDGSGVTQPVSGTVAVSNFPATQPVSGTITANQGTSPWVENVSQFGGNAVVTGTGASGAGIPRVTVSNDSNILATQSGTWTVTANAGTNLNTSALALDTSVVALQVAQGSTTSGQKGTLTLGAVTTAAPSYTTAQSSPLSLTTAGALRVDGSAVTQPVSIAATVTTSETTSGTSAITSVASSASSVSLLASNASRKNATFYNDSTQILYLKLGTTASATSYTIQMAANSYYELPVGKIYTGAIDGIWAAANGNVRITELT